jgi:beta-glucosidase
VTPRRPRVAPRPGHQLMRDVMRYARWLLLGAIAPLAAAAQNPGAAPEQPELGARKARIVERNGLRFKDLNRNGVLDPYEDWRKVPAERARDLVGRMTLEEKAGAMMHGTARSAGPMGMAGAGTEYDVGQNTALIDGARVTSMITRLGGEPGALAEQNNKLQEIAEGARLGIPVTVSTDPRHHFQYVLGASVQAGKFSQWPETLGLAATRDATLVRRFADIARQEYRAVGIQETLSPQADLATEPRWSRINGTFGEDAELAGQLVRAYVEGFQHGADGVDAAGVMAVVKHWVGYGAQKHGYDSHSYYGRFASLSGENLEYHVRPFLGAFAANVAGVMPTYSILEGATLDGRPLEQVGAGFNRQLLTDLLRKRYGFQGVILTDWAVTNDCSELCRNGYPAGQRPSFATVAMPWGVEQLPKEDRFVKAVSAGVDQFGGTEDAAVLVQAVRAGKLTEARLDESVHRILLPKFRQGLFENPYVDAAKARAAVGGEAFRVEAMQAQRRSLVLLENRNGVLPLKSTVRRVYLRNVDPKAVASYGWTVVADPAQADVAIVRVDAPFETLHPGYVFGAMQHEGDLGFRPGNADLEAIRRISARVPTIVTVYLDRPAILTAVKEAASALVGNFGVSDAALLDVLTGRARPEGKLPFELPSSMAEVEAQRSDLPHDTAHPLYPIGFGLSY